MDFNGSLHVFSTSSAPKAWKEVDEVHDHGYESFSILTAAYSLELVLLSVLDPSGMLIFLLELAAGAIARPLSRFSCIFLIFSKASRLESHRKPMKNYEKHQLKHGKWMSKAFESPYNELRYTFVLPFSRCDELEADATGLRLCAMAGYDPRLAAKFMERFASFEAPAYEEI